ncbi:MAG: hypothetical protein PHS95_00705 [Candidatus Pacebacteria bacterium]|nr:hypothetical protein [Candidatus Paceibacterota bacterium]
MKQFRYSTDISRQTIDDVENFRPLVKICFELWKEFQEHKNKRASSSCKELEGLLEYAYEKLKKIGENLNYDRYYGDYERAQVYEHCLELRCCEEKRVIDHACAGIRAFLRPPRREVTELRGVPIRVVERSLVFA